MCGWGPCAREASVWEAYCWHSGVMSGVNHKHQMDCRRVTPPGPRAVLYYIALRKRLVARAWVGGEGSEDGEGGGGERGGREGRHKKMRAVR